MLYMTKDTAYAQENSYHIKVNLTAGEYCEPIRIPGGDITSISYYLKTDAHAAIQVTLSSDADILADTADWIEIEPDSNISPSVRAMRGISIETNGTMEVTCQ